MTCNIKINFPSNQINCLYEWQFQTLHSFIIETLKPSKFKYLELLVFKTDYVLEFVITDMDLMIIKINNSPIKACFN